MPGFLLAPKWLPHLKHLFPCSHLCSSSILTIHSLKFSSPLPFSPALTFSLSLSSTSMLPICQTIFSISPLQVDLCMFFLGFTLLLSFSGIINYRFNILCFTASIHLWVSIYRFWSNSIKLKSPFLMEERKHLRKTVFLFFCDVLFTFVLISGLKQSHAHGHQKATSP